jgi:hypothetical protein
MPPNSSASTAAAAYFSQILTTTQGLADHRKDDIEQGKPVADQAVANTKTPAELATAYFQGILASK